MGQKFTMALAWTLNADNTPDADTFDTSGRKSLMDKVRHFLIECAAGK